MASSNADAPTAPDAAAPAAAPAAPATTTPAAPAAPTTVYSLIHAIHAAVIQEIDSPVAWSDFASPALAFAVTKPFAERFAPKPVKDEQPENASNSLGAVLYALFANKMEFLELGEADLSQTNLQTARALFCEFMAIKILKGWPETQDEEELTAELVRNWGALDGAPEDVRNAVDEHELKTARDSALELAILSEAKHFMSQSLIQHLVDDIYQGTIVYHPPSSRSLIADNYVSPRTRRRRLMQRRSSDPNSTPSSEVDPDAAEVYSYNPYLSGWLDYTRLRVPRWRQLLEFLSFVSLVILYVWTLSTRDLYAFGFIEAFYIAYSFGVILDEFAAAKESGWDVYFANAWNLLDMSYVGFFLTYLVLRIVGLAKDSLYLADLAFDILSLAGILLFPRLVFFFINSSVVILALRGMITTYVRGMCAIAVAFSGIGFCLWELGRNHKPDPWTGKKVVKLLFQIWFGSKGYSEGANFDSPFATPLLFVYALLSHSFIVVLLMGTVSAKYSRVYSNAAEEHLYQRVVSTLEGVKSDAVFSFLPPFNLLALAILWPLSKLSTPETLHRVDVFLIRVCNFPLLFCISAYERYKYRISRRAIRLTERGQVQKREERLFGLLSGGGTESLVRAAFDLAPPSSVPLPADNDTEAAAPAAAAAAPKPVKKEAPARLARLFDTSSKRDSGISTEEFNEVREGQKRLEEMLQKVMAVTGAGK